jgi:hypothetical protein
VRGSACRPDATGIVARRIARPRSPTMRIGRRGKRSTQTPAGSVKRMNGANSTAPSAATANGLASRTMIATSGSARAETCVPNWLIDSADQSLRKSGWRQSPRTRLGRPDRPRARSPAPRYAARPGRGLPAALSGCERRRPERRSQRKRVPSRPRARLTAAEQRRPRFHAAAVSRGQLVPVAGDAAKRRPPRVGRELLTGTESPLSASRRRLKQGSVEAGSLSR